MELDSSIETTLSQIQKIINANSIMGDAITTKDKVIIPISKSCFGFGVAAGRNSTEETKELSGTGGGAAVDPVALIVISTDVPGPDGVKILPFDGSTPLLNLISEAGKPVLDLIKTKKSNSKTVPSKKTDSIEKIKTKIKKE